MYRVHSLEIWGWKEEDFEVLFWKVEERTYWISGIIVCYAFTLDQVLF